VECCGRYAFNEPNDGQYYYGQMDYKVERVAMEYGWGVGGCPSWGCSIKNGNGVWKEIKNGEWGLDLGSREWLGVDIYRYDPLMTLSLSAVLSVCGQHTCPPAGACEA